MRSRTLLSAHTTIPNSAHSSLCGHTSRFTRSLLLSSVHCSLLQAIEKGYKVLEIIELYTFAEWRTTLFSDYTKLFFRVKTVANAP